MALIQTTSKDTLKRTALFACGGDVKAAEEIYDFFVKDMPNMPEYDAVPPSFMEQAKSTIGAIGNLTVMILILRYALFVTVSARWLIIGITV
jgi:hypothetical protein